MRKFQRQNLNPRADALDRFNAAQRLKSAIYHLAFGIALVVTTALSTILIMESIK